MSHAASHLVLLQKAPHGGLPAELLLASKVEDQQRQQDEEEDHPAQGRRDGRPWTTHTHTHTHIYI